MDEEDEELEEDDEFKEKLVRAVLLFCALVIAGVAAYTTFVLFSAHEIDISFSPPDTARFSSSGEEENFGTASFDIKREVEEDGEKKTFEDQPIQPFDLDRSFSPNPLIITEDLDYGNDRLVFIVIALEVIVIFLIYRKLDKGLSRKK